MYVCVYADEGCIYRRSGFVPAYTIYDYVHTNYRAKTPLVCKTGCDRQTERSD